jgi:hypothetical protein
MQRGLGQAGQKCKVYSWGRSGTHPIVLPLALADFYFMIFGVLLSATWSELESRRRWR